MPSSVVDKITYDEHSKTLRIRFVSGMIYDYKKVPADVYQAMTASGSKGVYLNKHIKGHYEFRKIK